MLHQAHIQQLNHKHKIIDFMSWSLFAFIISSLLVIASLIIISFNRFNLGLDFTGGIIMEIMLDKPIDIDQLRKIIQQIGIHKPLLQNFGSSRNIIIRIPLTQNLNHGVEWGDIVVNAINNNQNATMKYIEFIGPSIGIDLIYTCVISLLLVLILILIYIWLRFEWCLSISVVIALIHDIIITMGTLSLFHIEIDLTIIAAMMAVISYSLNDSIVISDRIRENFRKIHCFTPYEIINLSLTQTFYRTLITSSITLTMILILYLFGGQIIKNFALTMLIGVFIGTVSSIYVVSALALKFGIKREYLLIQKIEKDDIY